MLKHLLFAALLATSAHAQKAPSGAVRSIPLWPGAAPAAHGTEDADIPKLFVYPVAGEGPHPAVIVMPGGGYTALSMENEGANPAKWLAAHGIAAFVLQYRLSPAYRYPVPMLDGARAIRLVRSQAAQLHVDPTRLGVWGFSAGGHLAAYTATASHPDSSSTPDAIDRLSARPDFLILAYGRLSLDDAIPRDGAMEKAIGPFTREQIAQVSPTLHVTSSTPPSFIYSTTADAKVESRNATAFYDALKRNNVPAELHIFELGVHGTGLGSNPNTPAELAIWPMLLAQWLQIHHVLPSPASLGTGSLPPA